MKREILNKNKNVIAKVFTLIFFLFLFILVLRLGYLCLTGKVDGIDLKEFSNKRNTKKIKPPACFVGQRFVCFSSVFLLFFFRYCPALTPAIFQSARGRWQD